MRINTSHGVFYGGGGNDILGRLSNVDTVFGDEGNDIVYGGSDNDLLSGGTDSDQLNGGFGFDRAFQEGRRTDYQITVNGNVITLRRHDDTDTFTDVELIHFDNGPSLAIAYSRVEAVAHHLAKTWLGRDLTDFEGSAVEHWTGTVDDLLTAFHNLPQAAHLRDKSDAELLAGLETNPDILYVYANREVATSTEDDAGYLPPSLELYVDGQTGYDVLHMHHGRKDVHLEFNDERLLELTRLNDGAMLGLKNTEIIAFDSGETTVIAHHQVESILARLVHSFFDRVSRSMNGSWDWTRCIPASTMKSS